MSLLCHSESELVCTSIEREKEGEDNEWDGKKHVFRMLLHKLDSIAD